ncbi:hypothetical protein HDU96_000087 [Phlyctochytrium bullatum]|nr:hypothetical protein HDU96_000087 [Phlyctochytrium bullatum]
MTTPASDEYEVRTLRNGDEVEAFLDHLGTVFGVPKANGAPGAPRGLFEDHWHNDPHADLDGVAVAFAGKEVASSVRVYLRTMCLGRGRKVRTGGIGDVATRVEHRGKRLASKLMAMSESYMKSKGIDFAVLHAAPAAAPLYASLGWKAVDLGYYTLAIHAGELTTPPKVQSRPLRLDELGDVATARSLFTNVVPHLAGTFTRDHPKHWTKWVPSEKDTRRKISRRIVSAEKAGEHVAYMVLVVLALDAAQLDGTKSLAVEVREFFAGKLESDLPAAVPSGWDQDEASFAAAANAVKTSPLAPTEFASLFQALLTAGIEDFGVPVATTPFKVTLPSAVFPTEVYDILKTESDTPPFLVDDSRRENTPDGFWMYKLLSPFSVVDAEGESKAIDTIEAAVELFQEPLGDYPGCSGVVCDRTQRGCFLRTDNF